MSAATTIQLLRCSTPLGAYGFDATHVHAIERWENVTPATPGDAAAPVGHLGETPVFSLAQLLAPSHATPRAQGPVLLFDGFGLQVDRVARPATLPRQALRRLPKPLRDECGPWQAVTRLDGELTICLAPEALASRFHASTTPAPTWTGLGEDAPWATPAPTGASRLLCFRPPGDARDAFFGVSYRQAIEITNLASFTALRTAHPCLAGLMDWRDRAVPVVQLDAMLGLAAGACPPLNTRVVVVRGGPTRELLAFPAGTLAPVDLPLDGDTTVQAVLDSPSPYIRAAYQLAQGALFIPDLERIAGAA